jgi:hypothetical protein
MACSLTINRSAAKPEEWHIRRNAFGTPVFVVASESGSPKLYTRIASSEPSHRKKQTPRLGLKSTLGMTKPKRDAEASALMAGLSKVERRRSTRASRNSKPDTGSMTAEDDKIGIAASGDSSLARIESEKVGGGGCPALKMLRKYSYLACTFVILTERRLAVGLGLGRCVYRSRHCP